METVDLRKPVDVEKLSVHEHYQYQQRVRDLVSSLTLQSTKPIDRMNVTSHATSFLDAGVHMRTMASFYKEYCNLIPPEIMDPMMKTARKAYDSVRRDWLMTLTKVRDGVAPAESFYSYTVPGMSDREHLAYKKVLKENKHKAQTPNTGGFTQKKQRTGRGGFHNSRGGGGRGGGRNFHDGGGFQSDYNSGGFDPFQNQGMANEDVFVQNEVLVKEVRMIRDENLSMLIILRALKLQSLLLSIKMNSLKEEVTTLLLDVKNVNYGGIPFPPSYLRKPSSVGRGGHGGGSYNNGGNRGNYRGNNYNNRGNNHGGGGGGNQGGNQGSGGAAN